MANKVNILIVDDDPEALETLSDVLEDEGYKILTVNSGKEAIAEVTEEKPQVILLDIKMPDMDGIEVLRRIKKIDKDIPVIMTTAYGSMDSVIQAMRLGAYDYLNKPFDLDKMKILIKRALETQILTKKLGYLVSELEKEYKLESIVGESPRMYEVYKIIGRVVDSKVTILIRGETGTGKELVARIIHFNSPFKDKPFIPIDCASLPQDLLESELFGHERGSFTGAIGQKPGKFELATPGGTVFLDEIGNISLATQAKLLRVLQERKFERVGGTKPIQIDVRIIASTNADLERIIKGDLFREDLYHRLNVISINLPSLRERQGDIPLLVKHFLFKFRSESSRRKKYVPPETINLLMRYDWPGNVRELENVIESAVILGKADPILVEDLPLRIREKAFPSATEVPTGKVSLKQGVANFEKKLIIDALEKTGWIQVEAAKLLGINYKAIKYKMKKYGIEGKP
ncbi:sigma-54-dependent Fis family transcriptional regulator [Patescibacteria group bacterium]|nr:sigma-54-dependent Fis family transcriptional regulator [Patescibacteria group bacterium]